MVIIKRIIKIILVIVATLLVIVAGTQLYLLRGTPGRTLKTTDQRQDVNYTTTPTILIPG